MRSFKTEGIVIKRKNYGEADRILTVFTKREGKIQVRASGIRRVPSRRSAHVELLNYATLTLYRGSMFPTLTEAQTIESFSPIKDDLKKIGTAYHVCELVDGLCAEDEENERVFRLLERMLIRLATKEDIVETLHKFEIELLITLGFWDRDNNYNFDTHAFIENIMERKLRSHKFLAQLS